MGVDGADKVELKIAPVGPRRIQVSPWPFRRPAFNVEFARRSLPKIDWKNDWEFRASFFAAPTESVTLTLEQPVSS
jgi:hypothetical protein